MNYIPFFGKKAEAEADPKNNEKVGRFDDIDNATDDIEAEGEGAESSSLIKKTKDQAKEQVNKM